MLTLRALMLVVLAATSLPVFAQEKCVLEGIASDSISGEPLRKVTVQLIGGAEYIATTSADGRFHFEGFPAGTYELYGQASGYFKIAYGARKPEVRGALLHFDPGEKFLKVELKLPRPSSVSGKVVDENGEPVSGAFITAINPIWLNGRREYRIAQESTTDDTGAYRIPELTRGPYYLHAAAQQRPFVSDPGEPEQELLPVLYPDSPSIENATSITLESAQNLANVDFHLHTGHVFHVRGRANSDGRERFTVGLRKSGSDWVLPGLDKTSLAQDGTFDIRGVPPGSYVAETVSRRGGRVITAVPVEVKDSDVNGIVIPVAASIQVAGRIHMDRENGNLAGVFITLQSIEKTSVFYYGLTSSSGEIQIEDVTPGEYVLYGIQLPSRQDYVASIQYNGEEVLGTVLNFSASGGKVEIFIKNGAGEIDGDVESDDSQPPTDSETKFTRAMTAVLISDRPRLDHYGVLFAPADQNGHFSFNDLPPGKYHALASDDVDQGLWQNRDFLSQIQAKGIEIELRENGKLQIRIPVLSNAELESATASLGQ